MSSKIFKVVKRDGREVSFDKERIINAVEKAFIETDNELTDYAKSKAANIADYINTIAQAKAVEGTTLTVEEIQDLVEHGLMSCKRKDVAKAYILYRDKRTKEREYKSDMVKAVKEKLDASNVVNQNANLDEHSFGGRRGEAISAMSKQLALDYCMSEMSKRNHINNEIYIHDLDSYYVGMHNCLSIPYDELLANGFSTRQATIRPANSVNTAFQLVAVIAQLQSLMEFGGVSATHLDWTMVPYVRKSFRKHFFDGIKYITPEYYDCIRERIEDTDVLPIDDELYMYYPQASKYALDMTTKETYQAVEGMFHNLNTLQSRSGNQLPFTSINYGTCTLPEGRLVIKAILDTSIKGIGKTHQTSTFPCQIFQVKSGVNRYYDDPNYDLYRLALESTAKRLYPNYANCDLKNQVKYRVKDRKEKESVIAELSKEDYNKLIDRLLNDIEIDTDIWNKLFLDIDTQGPEDKLIVDWDEQPFEMFSTMGCRTQNGFDINAKECYRKNIRSVIETGKLDNDVFSGAAKDGRGNVCPVTIILPTIAMEAKDIYDNSSLVDGFMELLDVKIHEAKDMLIERYKWICSQSPKSADFMYQNNTFHGFKEAEGIKSAMKHGTLALGQIGLAETLQILIGCDQTSEQGFELAKRIEQLFADRCDEFKTETSLNFGVYFTPAENLCKTAMSKFKAKYGIIPNVSENKYFTNSVHVPVWKKIDVFKKIDIESKLDSYSNAGCILYCELDGAVLHNIDALEKIVNYAMDADVPYFAINVPNDHCEDCGYTGEFNDSCPMCGSKNITQLRRVTGYITQDYKSSFNEGKQQEVEMRVKHTGVEI